MKSFLRKLLTLIELSSKRQNKKALIDPLMGIILQVRDLEYEQTMSFMAVERRGMSNKYFALMEIAEKLAPDLAEDIQMYKERRREPEENSSSD